MWETKILLIFDFIFQILTSLHSFNLSFPLLFYVVITAEPKFPLWFPLIPLIPHILIPFSNSPFRLLQIACSVCNLKNLF